jgi:hypothetical protein
MSRLPYFPDNWLTDGGEVFSPMWWHPFTPRKIPGAHFCDDPRTIVWLEELGELENPMTSLGTDSTTFQLVA